MAPLAHPTLDMLRVNVLASLMDKFATLRVTNHALPSPPLSPPSPLPHSLQAPVSLGDHMMTSLLPLIASRRSRLFMSFSGWLLRHPGRTPSPRRLRPQRAARAPRRHRQYRGGAVHSSSSTSNGCHECRATSCLLVFVLPSPALPFHPPSPPLTLPFTVCAHGVSENLNAKGEVLCGVGWDGRRRAAAAADRAPRYHCRVSLNHNCNPLQIVSVSGPPCHPAPSRPAHASPLL